MPSSQATAIRPPAIGAIVGYILYCITIVLGVFLIITDPSSIAPVVIQIAGGLLVLFGIVEIIVTYSNRK